MKKYSIGDVELSKWTCEFLEVCEGLYKEHHNEIFDTLEKNCIAKGLPVPPRPNAHEFDESELIAILDYMLGFVPFNKDMEDYAVQCLSSLGIID